jgi:hypothetical protein
MMNTNKPKPQPRTSFNGYDSAIANGHSLPDLMDVKVRLSTAQAQHLWSKGYRFDDLKAILQVGECRLPVTLLFPSNIKSVAPQLSRTAQKVSDVPLKPSRILPPLPTGFKWLKFDLKTKNFDCPCIGSGDFAIDDFPTSIDAMCDHQWHNLSFIRRLVPISSANYAFNSDENSWLAVVTCNGKNYESTALGYKQALNDSFDKAFHDNVKLKTIACVPDMDNADMGFASQDATGPDQLEAVHDANVALTTARGESSAVTAEIPSSNVKTEYYSEEPAVFPHLTDRDLALPTLQWTTNQAAGAVIATYDLPYDILAANLNSPNYIPFQTYAQCEPQLTIRVQLQSVPANGGHLVVGVRYAALDEIANQSAWALNHVAQLVQTNHIILSAQSSNSSEIQIPFQYFLDRIPTTWNSQSNMLYYCTMYVAVLNPLVVGPESQNFVNVNFYCSFQCDGKPTRFFGQRNFFDPFAAGPVIRKSLSDKNQLRSLKHVVPNGGILSTVSDVVQTVAPIVDIIEPGLGSAIGGVAGIVGDVGNALPFSAPASARSTSGSDSIMDSRPLLATDHPQVVLVQNHGLALSTAPLDSKSMRLQKTFSTPQPNGRLEKKNHLSNKYISSVHGLYTMGTITTQNTPGTTLTNFAVTPANGFNSGEYFYPTPMGALAYLYSNYCGDIKMTLIFGSSLMHSCRIRAQYIPDYSTALVEGLEALESRNSYLSTVFDLQEQTQFTFSIPYQVLTPMAPIWQTDLVDDPATKPQRLSYGLVRLILETPLKANNSVSDSIHFAVFMSAGDNFQFAIPRSCVYPPIPNADIRVKRKVKYVTPNMEERFNDATLVPAQPTGVSGIPKHIGERHDIADLIKRYAIIAEDTLAVPTSATPFQVVADWPVNSSIPTFRVGGIFRNGVDSQQIDPLTHIQDAFRFNKGSTRYLLTLSSPVPMQFDVYHLAFVTDSGPNPTTTPLKFTVVDPNPALDNSMGSGSATEYWDTAYNSALSLEVPFYQHTSCLLSDAIANNALDETWSSYLNGRIRIVSRPLTTTAPFTATLTLYRAAGNDLHFSAFQGFPPRIDNSPAINVQAAGRVPAPDPPPTEDPPTVDQDFSVSYAKLKRYASRTQRLALRKVTPNMLRTVRNTLNLPNAITDLANAATDTARSFSNLAQNTDNSLTGILNTLQTILGPLSKNFNLTSFAAHLIVLRDVTATTFSRVAAFLGVLGLVGLLTLESISSLGMKIYQWITRFGAPPLEPDNADPNLREVQPDAEPRPQTVDEELSEICSLFVSSASIVMSIRDEEGLRNKLVNMTMTASRNRSVQMFVDIAIKWIRRSILWAKGEQDPSIVHAENLAAQSVALKNWSSEVDLLTSLHNQDKIFSSHLLQKRTADAKMLGATFFNDLDNYPPGLRQSMTFYYRRICEIYDQIGMRLGSGEKPQEPVSVWMYGDPGCGKSYAMDSIAIEILRRLKVVYTGDPIYTRDMNKYWNGYLGQPCIKYDDVGVNRSPEWMSGFVGEFFALHTPATFNPDQADIRDKNRLVNSRLIMVGSNEVTFKDYVGNDKAFRRRRDVVIACKQNPNFFARHAPGAKNCNDPRLNGPLLADFEHLLFRFQDPLDEHKHLDKTDSWLFYPELLAKLGPMIDNINERRQFAANNRQNLSTALSPEYWASQGVAVPPNDPQPLANDLIRIINATPDYYPIAWPTPAILDPILNFFSARPENRWDSIELVRPTAAPNGTYPEANTTLLLPEFETSIDFTRVNCHHRLVTTDFTRDEQFYTFGNIRVSVGSCGDNCDLTDEGLEHLKHAYDHACIYLTGMFRQEDLVEFDQPYGPARNWNGTLIPTTPLGLARIDAPRFNFHNIIDHILHRYNTFAFRAGAWLAENMEIVNACVFAIEFYLIYRGVKKLFEPTPTKIIYRDHDTNDTYFENAHPNLQQSGDVKTNRPKNTVRRSAARPSRPVRPDAPQPLAPVIDRNFIGLSFASRTSHKIKTISAFMIQDRFAICPMHFWEDLKMETEYTWTPVDVSPQIYSELAQRQRMYIEVPKAIEGPLKITCKGKPDLFVDNSATHWNPATPTNDLHLIDYPQPDDDRVISVYIGEAKVKTRFSKIKFHELNTDEDIDLACFEFLDTCVPQFRDTLSLFATESDLAKVNLKELELVLANQRRSVCLNQVEEVEFTAVYGELPSKMLVGFQYDNPAGYYPCSSILLDARHGRIIGFHTCSSKTIGYSLTITRELLPRLACKLPDLPEIDPAKTPSLDLSGEFLGIGAAPNSVHQTTRSTIIPSLIADQFPTFRYPARLASREDKFPGEKALRIGCEKQTVTPPLSETPEETDVISSFLHNLIITQSTPTHLTKAHLSPAEALEGIPGVPFIDPLVLSTSAGWPYNLTSHSLKKHYVSRNSEGKVDFIDPTFMKSYNRYHSAHLNGQRPATVFTDFLKDERLKVGKDTRLINGSSFEYTLEIRRYFLAFVSAFKARRFKNMVGIGMNVHGPDVTELVNHLRSKGDVFICGDYSSFGPTLEPNTLRELARLVNAWYDRYAENNTQLDNDIRTNLLLDAANSIHLAHDLFYTLFCGSPSGSPLTDVTNSYANLRYICRAWLTLTKPFPKLNSLSALREHLAIVVYGDDLIIATTPQIAAFFNNQTLSDFFATIGIRYTDASKTGTEPFCGLDKATFLKCNFIPHPTRKGQWLAALDWNCVQETPAWIRKSNNDAAATIENCNAALQLAHGHGPDLYKHLEGKVTEALQLLNIPFSAPTWAQVDRNFFESDEFGNIPLFKSNK